MPPDAIIFPLGDQARTKTQFLCPLHYYNGVSVLISQNLIVQSPDPDANCFPFGLNYIVNTASVWPSKDELHRVIGLTKNRF